MSINNCTLTQASLKEILYYHPGTGQFVWLQDRDRNKVMGTLAGWVTERGYLKISINAKTHKAHRLAWLYMYGEWPDEIDHVDGNKLNNKISNLRNVSRAINCQNLKKARANNLSTGLLGTARNGRKFQANIQFEGKQRYLGTFGTPEEAHDAYLLAKRVMHPGCTI